MPWRAFLAWAGLAVAIGVPVALSLASPLLAWRSALYIAAGLAGVLAMAVLLLQPLLATGVLPGLQGLRGRRAHRWCGAALVGLLVVHVAGLWLTSPPDMIDALLFRSPTPFSAWGVAAMWGVVATALLALFRRRLRPRRWRALHLVLAVGIVAGSILHALLIDGTMEMVSKALLCLLVALATLGAVLRMRPRRAR